ncbi:Os06g0610100, partial [Oryza sativa Japonica Group]
SHVKRAGVLSRRRICRRRVLRVTARPPAHGKTGDQTSGIVDARASCTHARQRASARRRNARALEHQRRRRLPRRRRLIPPPAAARLDPACSSAARNRTTRWSSATVAATTTGRSGGGTSGGIGPPAPSASAAANPPSASPRPPPSPPAAAAATTAAASLVNRGHDIMVRFDGDAGGVVVDGETYALRQMHWHSPSEHAVDGRRYDLELHMLHQSETRDGRYAVVAQLFDIGHRRDATLDMLEPYIKRVAKRRKGHEVEIDDDVDPRWPVKGSGVYYRYTGSFTTPPCTEGITWTRICRCGACRGSRWSSSARSRPRCK